MTYHRRAALMTGIVAGLACVAHGQNVPMERTASGSILRTFTTPYYVLHTDLGEAEAREADLRMTRMFEEYQRRTAGFSGQIRERFPFFLYRNRADYIAAGAPRGSAGVFITDGTGSRLMAIAGERTSARTWHVVQHEGFHQFVSASIKGDIPVWANEGLAEYFGEGIWTGDGFITGLIPPDRLDDIKTALRQRKMKPFAQMMTMTEQEWGDKLEYSNYDQAWAMVHFLAHGDNGKYQKAFMQFMAQASHGATPIDAWTAAFGKDIGAFERAFAQWWMNLPDNPTRSLYMKALVQTETSFYARALLQKQTFPNLPAFFKGYKPADLGLNRDLWLPPSLFSNLAGVAAGVGDWSLETVAGSMPRLACKEADGTKYVGMFVINNGKVTKVTVDITAGTTAARGPGTRGETGAGFVWPTAEGR